MTLIANEGRKVSTNYSVMQSFYALPAYLSRAPKPYLMLSTKATIDGDITISVDNVEHDVSYPSHYTFPHSRYCSHDQ